MLQQHLLHALAALHHHQHAHLGAVCDTSTKHVIDCGVHGLQVATMGTRRKLSVSVNSCGICGGVLKVSAYQSLICQHIVSVLLCDMQMCGVVCSCP